MRIANLLISFKLGHPNKNAFSLQFITAQFEKQKQNTFSLQFITVQLKNTSKTLHSIMVQSQIIIITTQQTVMNFIKLGDK